MACKSLDIRYCGWVTDQSVQKKGGVPSKAAQENTACSKAQQNRALKGLMGGRASPAITLNQGEGQGLTGFPVHLRPCLIPTPSPNLRNTHSTILQAGRWIISSASFPHTIPVFLGHRHWSSSDMPLWNIFFNIHEDHREALNIGLLSQNSHSSTVSPFNEAFNWHASMRSVYSAISFFHLGIQRTAGRFS